MNKVNLVGYVGTDIKFGEKFINFSVGTNESWIDKTTNSCL